ncbi:MAG TPA: chemotaxis protein CheB [Chryseosolibacter sp.]|jgi:Chemotaxis response regulator containing a CheY-like receiver domain and a methylesterase domain
MSDLHNMYEAIVMGASAGGFRAFSTLLSDIPAGYSIPILLVQHRSKDSRELFEEVLQSKCGIKIKQVEEKEVITGNHVYVAPPDYHLLIESNKTLSLSSDAPVCFSRPSIDVLFESAAIAYGNKLIGIILTGANDDGAMGITAIGKRGGLTIAQNPQEAEYPFMVQASIGTKRVKYIWSLATIRNFLLKLDNHS